ncbi:NH(3)-dependent NAD(+) synthetase [Paraliobacillus sp. PM-2]|uniref:NAD(+) synthase n=1 Tax=Paraliobacillus sp. PM-2 TaxID=1462524 RepID=UPI00061BEAE3|nr:NAD(+) synthase [Paraliobacillus sp. PM-2]CQR46964.1 NH(3)-dependent NAD(+) synthetase [Paraliobacillus sp. PM-2]
MQEKAEKLVKWLQQQIQLTGVKGLVVGVSGGIDSAVVANLIKRAAPNASLGVMMPCNSNPQDLTHAKKVVDAADIDSVTVDLTRTHAMMLEEIQTQLKQVNVFNEENQQLADANLRARLRMSTLYSIATNHNYLVVGTDNAAEWFTGYFTKYGDGGVDLVPLVHLTKGEVKKLAEYLDVPTEVINKKPSAGLWEGQTDENEMGTSYAMIDRYLEGKEIPEKDKEIIERLHNRTAHKRDLPKTPQKF